MKPSNGTVVRFVATYGHGFDFPLTRLVLGHGYGNDGGLSHRELLGLYFGTKRDLVAERVVYAGYLYVEEGNVKILDEGGSQTLRIRGSPELNRTLINDVSRSDGMKSAVSRLYTLITAGNVSHVMLAPQ